jgi:hypothetical protein
MSDHEFEKQVQQKLGELKLRPSDAVWMEVEKNIRDKKRRRRFLWLWSAALLVTLTTSGIVLYHYTNSASKTIGTANATPAASTSSSNTTNNTVLPNSTNKQATSGNASTIAQHEPATVNEPTDVIAPAKATASNGHSRQAEIDRQPAIPGVQGQAGNEEKQSTKSSVSTGGEGQEIAPAIALTQKNTYNKATTRKNSNKKAGKKNDLVTNRKNTTPVVTKEPVYTIPENESDLAAVEPTQQPDNLTATIPALAANGLDSITTDKVTAEPFNNISLNALMPDSATSANAVAAMPIQRKKASLWHWGVKGDAGYSRISVSKLFQLKGLFGTDKSYAEDLAARSYNSPTNSGSQFLNVAASTAPVKVASPIQADFSASVGLFIQRTISPRLKVSVGLEYSYMSVNTNVGKSFDSAIAVNIGTSSLKVVNKFYESPGYIDTVRGAYASFQGQGTDRVYYSQKHRYRFHYIEIPVVLNWQINQGKKLPPIVFEGGVSIGRLFAADALHYEGVKGVYYEDNSLFNKTQFNFVTGLSVGLLQKSKHPIWIGPDLRYSLNGLVKKEVSTGQYMWSTGISFKMLLGRL